MTKQFILDTLLPYKEDKTLLSISLIGNGCSYLSHIGNKCAIGKHMKEGPWQQYSDWVGTLFQEYSEEKIMSQDWLEQQIPTEVAQNIQQYHDALALPIPHNIYNANTVNHIVSHLERLTKFELSELYIK